MPPFEPTQKTRQSRAISFAATASPGNTWPPVPPVVIMTVPVIGVPPRLRLQPLRCPPRQSAVARSWATRRRECASYGESPQQAAILEIHAHENRDRDAIGDDP